MRRVAAGLTCALVLLALPACDADEPAKPAAQTTPSPTATPPSTAPPSTAPTSTSDLCERVLPTLAGDWKAEFRTAFYAPPADGCRLIDGAQPGHAIRVSVSILPVSVAEAAAVRRLDEAQLGTDTVAKIIDGGLGADSWAWNPAAAAPRLAFRTGDRLVRVAAEDFREDGLNELKAIARAIAALPGGIPAPQPVVERPECARGTAAAESLLGSKAVVRRDAVVDGHLFCQWGTPTRVVQTSSGGIGSDEYLTFTALRDAGGSQLNITRRVAIGAEGWQQTDGPLAFRTPQETFVSIRVAPFSTMRAIPVAALARAIEPAYVR
ncbi:hypothetical protein [Kribbella sp. CA-247076]|uniref:hypothetical protein n=1 Tax=Kribbella sp. CA-247076 TaxID=3239941 RepID=UPI003D8F0FA1